MTTKELENEAEIRKKLVINYQKVLKKSVTKLRQLLEKGISIFTFVNIPLDTVVIIDKIILNGMMNIMVIYYFIP